MIIWIKTTKDKYEYIIGMGDTAEQLAEECGTTTNTIYADRAHAKKKGKESQYKKVVID